MVVPVAGEHLAWMDAGPCTDDPEMWATPSLAERAAHECLAHCDVLDQCRQWAAGRPWAAIVVAGVRYGVHGGAYAEAVDLADGCTRCVAGGGCAVCGGPIVGRPASAVTCSPEHAMRRRRAKARERHRELVAA